MSNLNRVRLSCCWVGVGLGCDNKKGFIFLPTAEVGAISLITSSGTMVLQGSSLKGMNLYICTLINWCYIHME